MGDPLVGGEESFDRRFRRPTARLETADDREQAASVAHAVEAARFDLEEALRRLSRP